METWPQPSSRAWTPTPFPLNTHTFPKKKTHPETVSCIHTFPKISPKSHILKQAQIKVLWGHRESRGNVFCHKIRLWLTHYISQLQLTKPKINIFYLRITTLYLQITHFGNTSNFLLWNLGSFSSLYNWDVVLQYPVCMWWEITFFSTAYTHFQNFASFFQTLDTNPRIVQTKCLTSLHSKYHKHISKANICKHLCFNLNSC